jgi:hypothetical protein
MSGACRDLLVFKKYIANIMYYLGLIKVNYKVIMLYPVRINSRAFI